MTRPFALLLFLVASPVRSQNVADADPLVVGETFALESSVLGETRRINVYAPTGYAESDTLRLPVLYMPDGGLGEDFLHVAGLVQIGALNGTMRPHLLVGIENTERRRDLTGPTSVASDREIAPRVGGSAVYRAFLRDELMPEVEARYRTTGEKAIVGESLAGLFVVETLVLESGLFDTYIAIDPSLWWDGGRLAAEAARRLSEAGGASAVLALAASGEPQLGAATHGLYAALVTAEIPGFMVRYRQFPDEQHWTVYHPAALDAFRVTLGLRP